MGIGHDMPRIGRRALVPPDMVNLAQLSRNDGLFSTLAGVKSYEAPNLEWASDAS